MSVSWFARSISALLRASAVPVSDEVAEAVGGRLEASNDSTSVCSWDASVRPGVNGTSHGVSGLLGGSFDGGTTAQDDQVGERDPLAAGLSSR